MMALPQAMESGRTKVTFEQFLQMLDEDTRAEWVAGHRRVCAACGVVMATPSAGRSTPEAGTGLIGYAERIT